LLALYEREKAEGTELSAIIGLFGTTWNARRNGFASRSKSAIGNGARRPNCARTEAAVELDAIGEIAELVLSLKRSHLPPIADQGQDVASA
jgi:hypothetical protein